MKNLMERNVDAEMSASIFEEENAFRLPSYNKKELKHDLPPRCNDEAKYDASYWVRKLSGESQGAKKADEVKAPAGSLGSTPEKKKEESLIEKITGWISENPGTALLAALVIGGGSYMLYQHLQSKSSGTTDSIGTRKKPKRKPTFREWEKESSPDDSIPKITGEEIALGVAAAAAGALATTVMQEYSLVAAVSAGVLGIAKNNIPLIATAIGLVLGYGIRKLFGKTGEFPEVKTDKKLEAEGYVNTMMGYFKPQKEPFKS